MLARHSLTWLRWLPTLLVLLPWLLTSAVPDNTARIRDLSGMVSFRLLDWETVNLAQRAGRLWSALVGEREASAGDAELLRGYFSDPTERVDRRQIAERVLERVVGAAFEEAGIGRSAPLRSDRL